MSDLNDFLTRSGLAGAEVERRWTPLSGGVSSDIWRVDLGDGGKLCVKRALAKLKVAAEWHVPVSRNAHEWAYLQYAAGVMPQAVPRPLAHDPGAGLFAMSWLEPEAYPIWKEQLLAGAVDAATARAVGRTLGRLHGASSNREDLARDFDTGDMFFSLRLEPYLVHTALRHPQLADELHRLARRTAAQRRALVHGDVSPKNILVGRDAPVLLDAECAWYGDPAFDIAFCLNHLLLKAVPRPDRARELRASFDAFVEGYFAEGGPEPRQAIEARSAALLPALLLARVDGKSPVEYITTDRQRDRVRAASIPLIRRAVERLADVANHAYPALVRQGDDT